MRDAEAILYGRSGDLTAPKPGIAALDETERGRGELERLVELAEAGDLDPAVSILRRHRGRLGKAPLLDELPKRCGQAVIRSLHDGDIGNAQWERHRLTPYAGELLIEAAVTDRNLPFDWARRMVCRRACALAGDAGPIARRHIDRLIAALIAHQCDDEGLQAYLGRNELPKLVHEEAHVFLLIADWQEAVSNPASASGLFIRQLVSEFVTRPTALWSGRRGAPERRTLAGHYRRTRRLLLLPQSGDQAAALEDRARDELPVALSKALDMVRPAIQWEVMAELVAAARRLVAEQIRCVELAQLGPDEVLEMVCSAARLDGVCPPQPARPIREDELLVLLADIQSRSRRWDAVAQTIDRLAGDE